MFEGKSLEETRSNSMEILKGTWGQVQMLYNSDISLFLNSLKTSSFLIPWFYYFMYSYKTLPYVPGSELGFSGSYGEPRRDGLCATDPSL